MEITVQFKDREHINYDLAVTQNGEEVLVDEAAHAMMIMDEPHLTAPLSSSDPVDIGLTFAGYEIPAPLTGPIGDEVAFASVVPEFGAVAVVILGAAISCIAVMGSRAALASRV